MIAFNELTRKFLNWSKIHQEPRSTEWYDGYIRQYLVYLSDKADIDANLMKPFHLEEWVDSHTTWSNNYKRGAVVAINRVYNWAVKSGYIDNNPIKTAHKPSAERRKIYMKPEDYIEILSHINVADPFRDLVNFMWITGVRPQEARLIEPRHVNIEKGYVLFPKEEAKGKRYPRKIVLNDEGLNIIKKHMGNRTEGKVFLNTRKGEWSKYAVCNRFHRLSEKMGRRMIAYAARHGYGTRKLKAGHNHMAIAATMGHRDGSMLATIYSHVEEDDEHLRTVLAD